MPDVHTPEQRTKNMSRIKSRDTKPEMFMRSMIHRLGYRYRLHRKDLPGSPDIVLPKYKAVVFVNGCFWHRHLCHLFKWPNTRAAFWKAKINRNFERDQEAARTLKSLGWRVCTLWECSLKGRLRDPNRVVHELTQWLISDKDCLEIQG
jgi:DNA mismatch endonuclease, patch repair protein